MEETESRKHQHFCLTFDLTESDLDFTTSYLAPHKFTPYLRELLSAKLCDNTFK